MTGNSTQYYHTCGRIKYELWLKHCALPTFTRDGMLYVTSHMTVADEYALRDYGRYGLDDVIMRVVQELGLSEIAGMGQVDMAAQLRSIIEPWIHEGVSRTAQRLAGRSSISGARFRSALLEADKHDMTSYVFSFRLDDDEQLFHHGSMPCGSLYDGTAIPLIGSQASRNAVEIPLKRFSIIGAPYEPWSSSIPALRINKFVDVYRQPSSTRFFPGQG